MTLKELRKNRFMTLEQVSIGTNISQSTISKLERGQLPLHEDMKNTLEKFYGESFEYVEVPTYTEYLKLKEVVKSLAKFIEKNNIELATLLFSYLTPEEYELVNEIIENEKAH